jgi:hypothetical protein
MNKIIFAVALLAAMMIGVIGVNTANADSMETVESCANKVSIRCAGHDGMNALKEGIFGAIDSLVEPEK